MGVVNLFIGGSGKYVAETLQGLQAHYELPLPPTVAFDLNAVDTQTGSFALDNLHSPHPDFAGAAQGEVAPKWQSLQPGLMPDPQTQMPGPKLRPETQLMQKIGGQVTFGQAPDFGLWGMRAHGLLAFAAFLRPDAPASEMGKQQEFKHFLTEVFQESAADGSAVTINMVASTAGGTGAGMFLPFAWWLKRCFPDVTNPRINLFLVTPSAFDNLSLSGAPMVSMRTKARTGTFAIFKELQLMEHADISEFPAGAFPINTGTGAKHLEYRLGDNIFNRTFWMGRRSQDNQAENFEAYAETELLVRILGDASAANEVNAFTGDEQQHRLLPSVVTIDYPRLQIARRESSRIAEQALEYLRTGEGVLPPQAGHRFFDFPAQDPSAFGTFIQDNKLKIFAPNQSGESPVAAQDLENLVGRLVAGVDADQLFRNVLRGSQRNQSGYLAPAADWAAYCEGLCQDLNAESQGINKKLSVSIDASLQAEAATFRKFLVDFTKEFLDPGDGARPFPISVLREQKKEITQDLAKVTKFFSGDFRARLPSVLAARPRFATQQTLEDRITRQEGRLRNPPRPFEPGGLSKWRWVALFFVSLMGGVGPYVWANWGQQLAWPLTSTDGLGWWTVVVPIVLTVGMFVLLRRGKTKLEQLRRKEEGTLFRLYQDSAYAHVVHTLWAQVGESFGAQAVSALATLDERVGELDEVYRTLFTRAQARATQVTKPSPQTVASIGLGSSVPQNQMAPLRDRLLDGVRVDLAKANDDTIVNFVLHVKGQADNPTKGNVKNIADDVQKADAAAAQTDQVGQTTGMRDLKDLDAAIDQKSTNECAEFLPQTFQAALSNEGGATVLYEHLATLVHRTVNGSVAPGYDRRRPS
ncbi:MAG TPA: hypothetical protein DGO43_06790, partial [Chloroflexi bacterium]|nr:hypothetical protein [Chloroflexota bacterium]